MYWLGLKGSTISHDHLTMGQWVVGFCKAMQEESDQTKTLHMLDYLVNILENANDLHGRRLRPATQRSYVVWNRERSNNYSNVENIDRLRCALAQRHIQNTNANSNIQQEFSARKQALCQLTLSIVSNKIGKVISSKSR